MLGDVKWAPYCIKVTSFLHWLLALLIVGSLDNDDDGETAAGGRLVSHTVPSLCASGLHELGALAADHGDQQRPCRCH